MWRMYVAAVETLAAIIAPYGAQWILYPRQARRALIVSIVAFALSVSPLIVPAQMSPQERRQFDRHEERLYQLEKDSELLKWNLRQLEGLPRSQQETRDQVLEIKALIGERDKFLAWLVGIINTVALVAAGIAWMIRHRKQP